MRRIPGRHLTIQLTTFRRHETTMDVTTTHAMGDMLQQECKTRWTSTHSMSDSLMTMSQFPRLARMVRQYLAVLARFASPERLFSSVGLVKSDLWGRLLDTTLIDVMWAKQAP